MSLVLQLMYSRLVEGKEILVESIARKSGAISVRRFILRGQIELIPPGASILAPPPPQRHSFL